MSLFGAPPRYKITVELQAVDVFHHRQARAAAQRVAEAIEQLADSEGESQIVEVMKISVEKLPPVD